MLSDIEYPPFGYSTWSWTSPTTPSEAVKNFYNAWLNFSTSKEFTWMDHYNTLDAPDRRIRRSTILIIYARGVTPILIQVNGERE